ncbi:glutamate ABC transporter substrate-binding protein [Actinomadura rupiterrae]|uniref:glutamate ABC transporter substrate-binding protein n=1 Tax=Actinomadura rupiterrae TaxID=559627 RepID=UPI0020A45455|nr:glutamate ABC transporter substrate-binding protein [Actinomadura rupiterrae]MCP2339680.1 glutamate transport system substrate-binding protein [Actinomadura rupiterrae]
MRGLRYGAAALAVAASAALAAACGIAGASESSVAHKTKLVIGVNKDQPGLGTQQPDGSYQGFDIEIARQIARFMHAHDVEFKTITSATRETMLRNGSVDLVVGSYSITPERKTQVSFAGPYYVAHQSILVRAADGGRVKTVHDLAGRKVCQVPGSVSFPRVTKERGVPAVAVSASGYKDCLDALTTGRLDAVSTDDLILAGLYAQNQRGGGPALRLVNAPFSDEPYGVGIKQGDVDGCEAVNKAITQMYQQGIPAKLLQAQFGSSGLDFTSTVPQFEGCE